MKKDLENQIGDINKELENIYLPHDAVLIFLGKRTAFEIALELIDSLQQEQPEVDLEKELDQWRHEHFAGERDGHYSGEYLERNSQLDLARHFYELGLNARKEDK